ncbi:MAG: hypothetical protein ACE5JS_16160 [Nitrospinota bacterium]
MRTRPDRLQGTDGIRGVVVADDEESRSDPVGAFLRTERLTPSFAEVYARAFAEEETTPGDEVVVGWDPRDREGTFTGAVVRGVRGSARKAVVLGEVPTPAVPLAMVQRAANAGIMVTASHNPQNQNGLKAFLGPLATKLYPVDEVRLTRRVCELGARRGKNPAGPEGDVVNWEVRARELFAEYSCDPYNSWLQTPGEEGIETASNPLSDLILVVDAAGGSLADLACDTFHRLGVRELVQVNGPGAPVNQGGGVVELEQVEWVDRRCVSNSGRDLSGHAGVAALLGLALDHRGELRSGKSWAAAAVFDGDGDRCLLLVYDPFRDGLAVLDGDKVGLHLARFLAGANPEATSRAHRGSLYVNTVDSDLAAATAAARLGFRPVLTAVGDKWLLWRAGLSCARAIAEDSRVLSHELRGTLETLETGEGDARGLGEFCRAVSPVPKESLFSPGRIPFAVGSEASGHHVTLGRAQPAGGRGISQPNLFPVFAGNGLKAAVNAFVAVRRLAIGKTPKEWIGTVCRPFEAGHRRTCYAFYTDRARFAPGTHTWRGMEALLWRACELNFGPRYRTRRMQVSEEPGMLYLALDDPAGIQRAGVFVRNSGTEERTGVTVQGSAEEAKALDAVADAALKALLDLKREGHPYRVAEATLLATLIEGKMRPEGAEALIEGEVEAGRLLKEMERQGFVRREGELLVATELGRWYAMEILGG